MSDKKYKSKKTKDTKPQNMIEKIGKTNLNTILSIMNYNSEQLVYEQFSNYLSYILKNFKNNATSLCYIFPIDMDKLIIEDQKLFATYIKEKWEQDFFNDKIKISLILYGFMNQINILDANELPIFILLFTRNYLKDIVAKYVILNKNIEETLDTDVKSQFINKFETELKSTISNTKKYFKFLSYIGTLKSITNNYLFYNINIYKDLYYLYSIDKDEKEEEKKIVSLITKITKINNIYNISKTQNNLYLTKFTPIYEINKQYVTSVNKQLDEKTDGDFKNKKEKNIDKYIKKLLSIDNDELDYKTKDIELLKCLDKITEILDIDTTLFFLDVPIKFGLDEKITMRNIYDGILEETDKYKSNKLFLSVYQTYIIKEIDDYIQEDSLDISSILDKNETPKEKRNDDEDTFTNYIKRFVVFIRNNSKETQIEINNILCKLYLYMISNNKYKITKHIENSINYIPECKDILENIKKTIFFSISQISYKKIIDDYIVLYCDYQKKEINKIDITYRRTYFIMENFRNEVFVSDILQLLSNKELALLYFKYKVENKDRDFIINTIINSKLNKYNKSLYSFTEYKNKFISDIKNYVYTKEEILKLCCILFRLYVYGNTNDIPIILKKIQNIGKSNDEYKDNLMLNSFYNFIKTKDKKQILNIDEIESSLDKYIKTLFTELIKNNIERLNDEQIYNLILSFFRDKSFSKKYLEYLDYTELQLLLNTKNIRDKEYLIWSMTYVETEYIKVYDKLTPNILLKKIIEHYILKYLNTQLLNNILDTNKELKLGGIEKIINKLDIILTKPIFLNILKEYKIQKDQYIDKNDVFSIDNILSIITEYINNVSISTDIRTIVLNENIEGILENNEVTKIIDVLLREIKNIGYDKILDIDIKYLGLKIEGKKVEIIENFMFDKDIEANLNALINKKYLKFYEYRKLYDTIIEYIFDKDIYELKSELKEIKITKENKKIDDIIINLTDIKELPTILIYILGNADYDIEEFIKQYDKNNREKYVEKFDIKEFKNIFTKEIHIEKLFKLIKQRTYNNKYTTYLSDNLVTKEYDFIYMIFEKIMYTMEEKINLDKQNYDKNTLVKFIVKYVQILLSNIDEQNKILKTFDIGFLYILGKIGVNELLEYLKIYDSDKYSIIIYEMKKRYKIGYIDFDILSRYILEKFDIRDFIIKKIYDIYKNDCVCKRTEEVELKTKEFKNSNIAINVCVIFLSNKLSKLNNNYKNENYIKTKPLENINPFIKDFIDLCIDNKLSIYDVFNKIVDIILYTEFKETSKIYRYSLENMLYSPEILYNLDKKNKFIELYYYQDGKNLGDIDKQINILYDKIYLELYNLYLQNTDITCKNIIPNIHSELYNATIDYIENMVNEFYKDNDIKIDKDIFIFDKTDKKKYILENLIYKFQNDVKIDITDQFIANLKNIYGVKMDKKYFPIPLVIPIDTKKVIPKDNIDDFLRFVLDNIKKLEEKKVGEVYVEEVIEKDKEVSEKDEEIIEKDTKEQSIYGGIPETELTKPKDKKKKGQFKFNSEIECEECNTLNCVMTTFDKDKKKYKLCIKCMGDNPNLTDNEEDDDEQEENE